MIINRICGTLREVIGCMGEWIASIPSAISGWRRRFVQERLPDWCRQRMLDQMAELQEQLRATKQELADREAYIQGLHDGMRLAGRVMDKSRPNITLERRPDHVDRDKQRVAD